MLHGTTPRVGLSGLGRLVSRGSGVDTRITGSRSTMVDEDARTRRTGRTLMDRPKTLVEKVWENHVVRSAEGEPDLLYVDLHLVHEVTSPQAFEGLRLAGRGVRRPDVGVRHAHQGQGFGEADGGPQEQLRGVRNQAQ